MTRRLLVSAFGIHMGGGLVLLESLAEALRGHPCVVLLDERVRGHAGLAASLAHAQVRHVARSMPARHSALRKLAAEATRDDILLCFNSLPPLARPAGRVVTFVQAPHFVGSVGDVAYPPLTRLRLAIEARWLRRGIVNTDEVWVQTPTMQDLLLKRFPSTRARIAPLVDDGLMRLLAQSPRQAPAAPAAAADPAACRFFYPADLVGHKNHDALVDAWQILARDGFAPQLSLTLREHEWSQLVQRRGGPMPANVVNLGRMPRTDILAELARSSALIFPSRAETFGLPMIEARALGIPVIAAERDFVRDVCAPRETFDPMSARSIAAAVRRFVDGRPQDGDAGGFWSAAHFIEQLLA
jgi:glycosyltransferase involved in cell wall biosynthesis